MSTQPTANDAVPVSVRYLSELFKEVLAEVKFPDVDAASLVASVSKVDAFQADVTRLEEELSRARAALDAGRDDLIRLAGRAHAYARVFAEDDDALRTRIDAISLPRARVRAASSTSLPTETAAVAPRRKKRATAEDGMSGEAVPLFGDTEREPVSDAAAE